MWQKVKNALGFSRSETRGFVVLLFAFFCIAMAPYAYERHFRTYIPVEIEELQLAMEHIEEGNNRQQIRSDNFSALDYARDAELFAFDPNNLPLEDWIRLGLTEKQARTIKNYEVKGGKFYRKEDVRKMYSISDEQYQRLAPYIKIPKAERSISEIIHAPPEKKTDKAVIVELNQADSVDLLKIAGIGPAFASRIIKYRNLLGGFFHENQLLEVWGLDSVRFEQIRTQVSIDVSAIRKININADAGKLTRLPYLNYKQKNAIFAFRKQHGNYKDLNDLRKVILLSDESIQKIAPYIKFND